MVNLTDNTLPDVSLLDFVSVSPLGGGGAWELRCIRGVYVTSDNDSVVNLIDTTLPGVSLLDFVCL